MPLGPHLAKAEGQETQPSPRDSIWLHSHYPNSNPPVSSRLEPG